MKEAKYACRLLQGRLSVLFIVALLGFGTLWAQNKTVTGLVKDDKGESIIGASVMVKGTKIATITNIDGKYRISVPADAKTLVITYVGMEKKEVQINGTTINVVLQASDKTLDEVVVVGYGTMKKRDLTGSVSSVSEKQLKDIPVSSVAEALTGKLTGVQITTTEGSPDADIKIRVRGGGSITQSNSPLYIVDGFAKDDIKDIAPSEIEDISVLKDASSTAIYGSRGANGVVLITTRSAKQGKISLSYNGYVGIKNVSKLLDVQSPYEFAKRQYERSVWNNKVSSEYENYFGSFDDLSLYNYVTPTNWQDETFGRTGLSQNHSISLNGGNKKFSYNATYSYVYDKAIMYMSDYKRNNASVKLKYTPAQWIKIDFNTRYAGTLINGSGANDQTGMEKSTSDSRVKSAVIYSPINLKNLVSQDDDADATASLYSPLKSSEDNNRRQNNNDFSVNGGVLINLLKNISFNSTVGYTQSKKNDKRFFGLTSYYVREGGAMKGDDNLSAPAVFLTDYDRASWQNTNVLNFKKDNIFRGHNISAVLGQETLIRSYEYSVRDVEKLDRTFNSEQAWANVGNGKSLTTFTKEPDYRLFSYFGRLNYDYEGRYLLAATLRADGSSKFANGNQWGIFPSVSVGWRLSDEGFMKETQSWLSNLKFRAGYGEAGNDNIDNSAFIRSYLLSQKASYQDPSLFSLMGVTKGTTLANPNLKWETNITQNLGVDFGFLKGRLNGSVEMYSNKTLDALMKVTLSGVGYTDQWQNAASTQNRGVELTLNADLIQTKDFNLSFSVNVSKNKNKVLTLKNGVQSTFNEGWTSYSEASNSYIVSVGQPVGLIYGFVNDGWYAADDFTYSGSSWGVNRTKYPNYDATTKVYSDNSGNKFVDNSGIAGASWGPGAQKLKDTNGDGKITIDDKVLIGNTNPKHFGAFSFTATYKGFDASANFNWVYGNQIYNATKIELTAEYYKYRNMLSTGEVPYSQIDWNTGTRVTDGGTLNAMNANATIWAPTTGKYATTSWAIEDGSFLRFNTLTIGYTVPKKITKKAHIEKIRIYGSGYNLYTWTKYTGYDPEVDTRRATPATPGVDYSAYPKSRSYNLGVNITF
ncbi:MAG: TonB-dependent receptor SusC [Bacteroidota bacterium]|jgi:TonB-linked SusC/RagA family outer membrane protein